MSRVYEIPDWKANYLTKKQSELLDEKESEEEATEATEASVEPSDAGTATTPAAAEPQPVAEPAPADPNASGGQ